LPRPLPPRSSPLGSSFVFQKKAIR
jgi:hypothetical protein